MKTILTVLSLLFFHSVMAQNWNEKNKITAGDRDASDKFGLHVSVSGNIAAVGSPHESHDSLGMHEVDEAGSVYIYERGPNGKWQQQAKLYLPQRMMLDNFGCSVSLDGNLLLVGAKGEDEDENGGNYKFSSGAAYLFERQVDGSWNLLQKLVASDRKAFATFGNSVSIDGDRLVVGSIGEEYDIQGQNQVTGAGAAYIFELDSTGTWTEVQKIVASDRSHAFFGYSVSISGDRLICGAYYDSYDQRGQNYLLFTGSAYLFERNQSGVWSQVAKLAAYDRDTYDFFGTEVSVDGDYAIVGAPYEDEDLNGQNVLPNSGSAYIFKRSINGVWQQLQKLKASDKGTDEVFGISVDISGSRAIVGAFWDDHDPYQSNYKYKSGSAYMFEMNSAGMWIQEQKVASSDRDEDDYFGCGVAIDGGIAIVGAYGEEEDTAGTNHLFVSGSAYMFEHSCITSSQRYDTVCPGFISSNGQVWSGSGTFTEVLQNAAGCDSIITAHITVVSIDTLILKTGATLAVNTQADAYQWLDCNVGYAPLSGATQRSYTPSVNGSYAVEITQHGCVDTSSCHSIVEVGISEERSGDEVHLWPNPTSGQVHISLGQSFDHVVLNVRNPLSQLVYSEQFDHTDLICTEIDAVPGLYVFELKLDDRETRVFKVLIE